MKEKRKSMDSVRNELELLDLPISGKVLGGNSRDTVDDEIAVEISQSYQTLLSSSTPDDNRFVSYSHPATISSMSNKAYEDELYSLSSGGGDLPQPDPRIDDIAYHINLDPAIVTASNGGIDWGALGSMVLGIGEVVAGVATVEAGAGVFLIVDGVARTGFELANFLNSVANNNTQPEMHNLGEAITYGFMDEDAAYWGRLGNDVVTALISGGVYDSIEDAIRAVKDSNYLRAVKSGYESYSGADDAVRYFTEYKGGH